MLRTVFVAAAALAGALSGAAHAQTPSELTMFGRGDFKGSRVTVSGARQGINPPLSVRSLVVPPGTQWELCSGNTFTGCRRFNASRPAMVMTVRSLRPVAPALMSSPTTTPPAAGTALGQSLRGWASEFFVTPDMGGHRIEVQPGIAAAASERAREFCRSRGWRSSAHQRVQTVAKTSFLADVLCVDAGR